ncbi:cytochrome c-type biogenesis protein CcmE homolog, mitochondrial [Impatiens glandulifera]|uniref:cytochrome c-type biogenesis protein CcmE homolog, mitochondrial n=1 Tax=Impatiens glandulifera TaxID=253017 RepID=UPI001FB0B81D|nr:cytochrome c-type biogenesis protein CcmE homolog, mitochondrial [Impatiens glandulifera]
MGFRLCSRIAFSRLLQHQPTTLFTANRSPSLIASLRSQPNIFAHVRSNPGDLPLGLRFFSTGRRQPTKSGKIDIGARARQMQNRRLWTYALTFSSIAGFIVIVLNQFQDQMIFYVTPSDALEKYNSNPSKNKFRLGGLVLEGSVAQSTSSPDMEFVITDLITDILVRYRGSLPDLFREGHSVVAEGFVKPITDEIKKDVTVKNVSEKARKLECYFSAIEVLAKHDEKYMPKEVAEAIERNKKKIAAGETGENGEEKDDKK